MRVALTGTPGTGKSSVATSLRKQGYTIVRLHTLAREAHCIEGYDKKRKSQLIEIPRLNTCVRKMFHTDALVVFEGLLGHLLSAMDKVIILRCHPAELRHRLKKKRWNKIKIKENVDAEALDVILCEAVDCHPKNDIFEIDTTEKTVDEVASCVKKILDTNFQPAKPYSIGQIDWSEEILKESDSKE